jgi:hypothetical protein
LAAAVQGSKDVTIFAPTDAAFAAAAGTIAKLTPEQVSAVLKYHVVKGVAYSTGLKDGQTFQTLLGQKVKISVGKGGVKVNGVKVIAPDQLVANGVVHVVERYVHLLDMLLIHFLTCFCPVLLYQSSRTSFLKSAPSILTVQNDQNLVSESINLIFELTQLFRRSMAVIVMVTILGMTSKK